MLRKKLKLSPLEEPSDTPDNEDGPPRTDWHTTETFNSEEIDIPQKLLDYEKELSDELSQLVFSDPVHYVYNPLVYAIEPHSNFVRRYCKTPKDILFLGLNPGPYGMCQTGVPFGEINSTKDWLKITGRVDIPEKECEKMGKEIKGFDCTRVEQSGKRFYGLFKEICSDPDTFFQYSFVYNLCPLAFMKKEGANVTPAEFNGKIKKDLAEICQKILAKILRLLEIKIIIGLGRHAEEQAKDLIKNYGFNGIKVIYMPHPSPRALHNQNWDEKAKKVLEENNLMKYFQISK